jgi:hypothetical protein
MITTSSSIIGPTEPTELHGHFSPVCNSDIPPNSIICAGPVASYTTTLSATSASRLTVDGSITVTDDIDIGDKSLKKTLQRIEDRLNILTINPELEEQWEELRVLGDEYRKLEERLKQMNKVWDILSSD